MPVGPEKRVPLPGPVASTVASRPLGCLLPVGLQTGPSAAVHFPQKAPLWLQVLVEVEVKLPVPSPCCYELDMPAQAQVLH